MPPRQRMSDSSAPPESQSAELRRVLALASVHRHIAAHRLDGDPSHIVNAFHELTGLGVSAPLGLQIALSQALKQLKAGPGKGRRREHAARDAQIIALARLWSSDSYQQQVAALLEIDRKWLEAAERRKAKTAKAKVAVTSKAKTAKAKVAVTSKASTERTEVAVTPKASSPWLTALSSLPHQRGHNKGAGEGMERIVLSKDIRRSLCENFGITESHVSKIISDYNTGLYPERQARAKRKRG